MFALAFEICCLVVLAASLETGNSTKFDRIDQLIRVVQNKTGTPGIAVAVVVNGEAVFTPTYGLRDFANDTSHVTTDTLFHIASCTKAFTSYQIASLVREGLIAYDDPVIKHIPEFRMNDPDVTKNILVKDLLCMVSGLPAHDSVWYHSKISRYELFERIPYLPLNRGLREKFQYNSIMYTVAGLIAEQLINLAWEDDIQARIFKPLNMSASLTSFDEALQLPYDANLAKGHSYEGNSTRLVDVPMEDASMIAPAAGIFSNVNDMVKWIRFQMSETIPKEMHVLKTPYLYENDLLFNGTDGQLSVVIGYAYGWIVILHRGQYVVQHTGVSDGYCTVVSLFPEEKHGYVIFANLDKLDTILRKLPLRMDDIMSNRPLLETDEEWLSGLLNLGSSSESDKISPGKQLGNPKQYVGRYWNPGYGNVKVTITKYGLFIVYNDIHCLLAPGKGNDYFILLPQTYANTHGGHVTECSFERDSSNDIVACLIDFEPDVSPIVFVKQLSEESDLKYLGSFVGVFVSGSTSVKISLNREKHILVASGVPSYDPEKLHAVKRDWFSLNRTRSTLLFEFVFENGTISGLNIHRGASSSSFTKQLPEENDLKYLGSFVGVFKSGTTNVKISLNQGEHLLAASGVPSYDADKLIPVKHNWFFLNRSTLLFEFVFTNGTISELNVRQGVSPSTNFTKQWSKENDLKYLGSFVGLFKSGNTTVKIGVNRREHLLAASGVPSYGPDNLQLVKRDWFSFNDSTLQFEFVFANGTISALNIHRGVSLTVFTKQLSEGDDLKYLASFVGIFTSGGTSVKISLNQEEHLLVAEGIPSYDPDNLKPLKRDWFILNHSTLLFEFGFANGTMSELSIHQGTQILFTFSK